MNGFEFSHRADPFATRELVDLRRNHRRIGDGFSQPVPGLDVTVQPGMPGVHQHDRGGLAGARKIRLKPVTP